MNSGWGSAAPLLSQEGWRTAPGWFQSETLQQHGFGTTPRVIAMQSRCPPNLGGQFPLHVLIPIHSHIHRPRLQRKFALSPQIPAEWTAISLQREAHMGLMDFIR